jgi:hypothetical protein
MFVRRVTVFVSLLRVAGLFPGRVSGIEMVLTVWIPVGLLLVWAFIGGHSAFLKEPLSSNFVSAAAIDSRTERPETHLKAFLVKSVMSAPEHQVKVPARPPSKVASSRPTPERKANDG